jgi:predicted PurR-regulated permease PerM
MRIAASLQISSFLSTGALIVLISVLIGAELAGVLGALAAIPVAGALQVVFLDWLRHRRAEPIPETG